jgi:glycolate oxidase FAD binding subunit
MAESVGGSLVLLAASDEDKARIGAWGTPPATLDVMRRLKAAFDPGQALNPGRFVV